MGKGVEVRDEHPSVSRSRSRASADALLDAQRRAAGADTSEPQVPAPPAAEIDSRVKHGSPTWRATASVGPRRGRRANSAFGSPLNASRPARRRATSPRCASGRRPWTDGETKLDLTQRHRARAIVRPANNYVPLRQAIALADLDRSLSENVGWLIRGPSRRRGVGLGGEGPRPRPRPEAGPAQ